MQTSLRSVRFTLLGVFLLVCIGGLLYAYQKSIPAPVAAALAIAFGIEVTLYVLPGFAAVRKAVRTPYRVALAMTASAVAPYCVYTVPLGLFAWSSFAGLLAIAAAVSFWYVVLPRRAAVDLAFIGFAAAMVLINPFRHWYPSPVVKLPLGILGQLMWTRLALFESLAIARMEIAGFGFLPDRREWATGIAHFLAFLPVGVLAGWALSFTAPHLRPVPWWLTGLMAVGLVLGVLWFIALPEEVFFRGLLQDWLGRWTGNQWVALIAASALFGLVHLPFRHFPNWRFALLAGISGLFYGSAYRAARSVRAAMVTHALVVTTWKLFFA